MLKKISVRNFSETDGKISILNRETFVKFSAFSVKNYPKFKALHSNTFNKKIKVSV